VSASRKRLISLALAGALIAAGLVLPSGGVRTAHAVGTVSVSFPAAAGASLFNAQFSTQDVWANWFPNQPAGTGGTGINDRMAALNAPFFRVHAGTDGSWGPITGPNDAGGGQSPALPFPTAYVGTGGGSVMSIPAWDFSQLNLLMPSTHDSGSGGTVSYSTTTVTDTGKSWQPGLWVNRKVTVGSQSGTVSSNTATTLTLKSSWSATPAAGTTYTISSAIGSTPILMDVRYLPDVMYGGACGTSCLIGGGANTPGGIADQTYAAYASYMAALVNYYNKGVSPSGAFPSTPPPGAGPIKYWEIYNEPDFAAENPRVPPTILAPLLAGITISGVNVSGGTLTPGSAYTYELTATTVPGVETTPSAPISIVLPAGDNAVRLQFSRAISQTLSKIPPGYRIYGRSGTVSYLGFIGRDTATTSCAGGTDCLTWTDAGASAPDGSTHPPASNSTGYEAPFSPLEYKKMWDVVVPAMKAVDPTIKVIGPVVTNTYSISPNSIAPNAITTGPGDNSWQDNRDYVQVLMTSSNKPDIVSFHQYGGFQGTETEQQMLDSIDLPGAGSVSMYQGLQKNILPYTGSTPLIQTETGVNANQLSGTTAYKTAAIKGFGAAWFGHMAARLGTLTPNLQSIFQFQLLESPTLGAVAIDNSLGATPGDPYLNYWLMATLNARIPQGSKLLSVSGTPSGMDVVAVAIPPSFTTVEVMVVNRQPAATCCSGLPQSTTVSLSGATSTQTNLWMVDDSTSLANGPSPSNLGTSTSVTVNFANGYGVAFVEFATRPTVTAVYTALAPQRLLDTRISHSTLGQGIGVDLPIGGVGSVPANATAVILNVTAVDETTAGFFTVYPTGNALPTASNLNWTAGETVPNLVSVGLGAGGSVTIFNGLGSADAIVDLEGYFAPSGAGTAGQFVPVVPARITDTRAGSGQPNAGSKLTAGFTLPVQVTGVGGIPASGVTAVVLNTTVTDTTTAGFLTVFPTGTAVPTASNLNWTAGVTVPNRVTVPVSTSGQVSFFNGLGSSDVIVDVSGYYTDSSAAGASFVPLAPARIADTRNGIGALVAGETRPLQVAGNGGVPATGAGAVVLNVTVANPTAASDLVIWPDGSTKPTASDLNFAAGQTVPNLVVVKLSASGVIDIFNAFGSTNVIVDVVGWYG
jgi:hypothetical protein